MPDRTFPDLPPVPFLQPTPVELVVPREPLRAIGEVMEISIHDIVNDPHRKRQVAHLWRIRCRIANETWLRSRLEAFAYDAWLAANL